ncbi:MAG: mechanosensitive ion channel family protein [Magnetococcales bacterium]|nr:mechanosensitive ion channel family protein [Magnetococcales bacterium]MBF0116173.1 mechanosensitive ion channel family protein [Magnetococcales bacterium]
MNDASWWMILLAGLLAALLVITAVAVPLRRLRQSHALWGEFFASLSVPISMLLGSALWLTVLTLFPAAFGNWQPHGHYRDIWFLFWVVFLLFNLSEGVGRLYYTQIRKETQPGRSLLWLLGRIAVVTASVMVVLQFAMDLNASQLLTSTALVATVLGIALREVLSNFLAGISINLTGTAQPAQWIAIGDKEGEIIHRNWRETRIRSTGGHIYIIPNSMIAHHLVNNMTWDSPLRRHQLDFPIDFSVTPAIVCAALRAAALSVPEVDRTHKLPDAMVASCREQCMFYRVRFWSRTFHDRSRIEGLVQERVWYHLQRQGIQMGGVVNVQGSGLPALSMLRPPKAHSAPDPYALLQQSGFVARYLMDAQGQLLLPETALQHFADQLTHRLFGPGEQVLTLGEQHSIGFIHVRGELIGRTALAALRVDAGRFQVTSGDWVGEITLFSGLPRNATVTVGKGDAELLEVPATAFHFLLSCHEEIVRIFQHRLAQRSKQLIEELAEVAVPH